MNIGDRMKLRRKELRLSAEDVAEKIGVNRSTVFRYEKGEIEKLPIEILEPLSEILKTTPEYLMGWDNQPDIIPIYNKLEPPRQEKVYNYAEHQLSEQNKVVSIVDTQTVFLNSKLSAGTGILDLDPTDTKEIEYKGHVPKHDLAFMVDGDSMYPMFEDREVVFVEKTPDIHNGQFIAVQINEEAYIKKVYKEEDCLRLVSLNKEYDDIIASEDDDIRVIGRIIL